MLRPLVATHGIPAFVHDWSWPPDPEAAWGLFRDTLHPYLANNFGQTNFYVGSAPQALTIALAIGAFGSVAGLKALAIAIAPTAAIGAFAFARRVGASLAVAAASSLAYAASPVVANQFAAGHIGDLFGYAMLPLVAICGLELARGGNRRIAALGLLVAVQLSIGQLQYAVFDGLVLAAFVPFATDVRGRWIVVAAALLAPLASPLAVALALFAHPLAALSFERTNLLYEQANSGAFWASHIGASYIRDYESGAGRIALVARAIGGLGLWAFALWNAFARRKAIALLALAIGAAWICAGANGPLWFALSAAFVRVPQLAVFRELYHFSAPLLLALTALVALTRGARATIGVCIAAVLFVAPQASGSFWELSRSYDPAEIATIARIVDADRSGGYVLYWPVLQPLGERVDASGADPDAFPIGTHAPLSEFTIHQPLVQVAALLCARDVDAQALLARFGIRYVIVRPHWRSYYRETLEPSLRALVAGRGGGDCAAPAALAHLRTAWSGPTHALMVVSDPAPLGTASTAPLYRLGLDRPFVPSELTPDPRTAWVDASRWQWWDPTFGGPVDPGVFSLGGTPFVLPPHPGITYLILNAPAGATLEGDKDRTIPPEPGYRAVVLPESAVRILSPGPTILSGYASDPRAVERRALAFAPRPSFGAPVTTGMILQYVAWCAGVLALVALAWSGLSAVRRTGL